MTQLEHIYLMNVVLYFTKEEQLLAFAKINKKCDGVLQYMKINPFLENTSLKRIKQLFQSIETYQLEGPTNLHETFDDISIIEYNNKNNKYSHLHRPTDIQSHAHKIKKLHSVIYNNDFETVAKSFTILSSLKVLNLCDYEANKFIHSLLILKDVLINLRNVLKNVRITIIFIYNCFDKKINADYVDCISKIQGIKVYINQYDENIDINYFIPINGYNFDMISIIKNKKYYYYLLSICYPTALTISNKVSHSMSEIHKMNNSINKLNFEPYSMLSELSIKFPQILKISFFLPTTLTTLSIASNGNSKVNYDSLNTISLNNFYLREENEKNITLPSTLTRLSLIECISCSFTFKEKWNLKNINYQSCSYCIIPICDSYKYFNNKDMCNNKYIKYGNASSIDQFFDDELFYLINFNENVIEIGMKNKAFVDVLNLSIFETQNIKLIFTKTNKLIVNDCALLNLRCGSIKEINITTCKTMICYNVSSINSINGENVNYLEFISKSKPQIEIKHIETCLTNSNIKLKSSIKTLKFKEIEKDIIDLTSFTIENLILYYSNIKQLSIPSTITSFENNNSNIKIINGFETTKIPSEQKNRLAMRYCNEKIPRISSKQLTIKSKTWKVIDAREIKVDYLAIVNCMELKDIFISNEIKTLVISQCDKIETLNLTSFQLKIVNVKNCKSIKTLLVNSDVKLIISSCPLLN
ncbi:hypothetical protein QTN25_004576 [Entamoeba marina]